MLYIPNRQVILPTSCFDSKPKFLSCLREQFSSGSFSLSGFISQRDVVELYKFLKNDYHLGVPRICSFIKHVGHQCYNQWYINEEVHEIFNDLLNIIALFCVKRHLTQLVASVTKILLYGTVNFYFLLVQCVLFITMSCFSTKYCFPHGISYWSYTLAVYM